ncbi:MAG TPA: hypothetical protein VFS39_04500 [Nitrospira sp.]|nr:hypothetical protein [Nitrospira sp.]
MTSKYKFPSLPECRAVWAPIYLEPIVQSGERITVGIAAVGSDGSIRVVETVAQQKLRCVFGKEGADAIANITGLCITALSVHLEQKASPKRLASWAPPMSGIHMGEVRNADGSSLDEIINTALKLCSSFAVPQHSVHMLSIEEQSAKEDEKWVKQIRSAVARSAPQLKNSFRKRLHLIEHGRDPIYDFLGSNYVANFGRLNPKRVSHALATARIKLWTLGVARDDKQLFQIPQDRYELIIWNPLIDAHAPGLFSPREIEEVKEGFAQIEEEAHRKALKVRSVISPAEASRHIIDMEMAA